MLPEGNSGGSILTWGWAKLPCYVTLVLSDCVRPHGLQLTRLLRPRDSSGENPGEGCPACTPSSQGTIHRRVNGCTDRIRMESSHSSKDAVMTLSETSRGGEEKYLRRVTLVPDGVVSR